jgi:hypothetical protein
MAKKKEIDHTTFRNGNLFCTHCGGEQVMPMPMRTEMLTAMISAFNKIHGKCERTWAQPMPPADMSHFHRVEFWKKYGEQGTSSKTMWLMLRYGTIMPGADHPHDIDDFSRCHMPLEMVPDWRKEMEKMKEVSAVWESLANYWEVLTEMYVTKQYAPMWELMKKLCC